jgi:hypothetical protein
VATGAGTFRADAPVKKVPKRAWQKLSAGRGAKGQRFYDWAVIDLTEAAPGSRQLLIRRNRTTVELAYYRCFSPQPVPLTELVRIAGSRWHVEETFQTEKGLAGLDEHQVRRYPSWIRWVTLAMLAHAFLAAARADEHARTARTRWSRCPATRSSACSSRLSFSPSTTSPTDSAGPSGDAAISRDHAPAVTSDKPHPGHEDHDLQLEYWVVLVYGDPHTVFPATVQVGMTTYGPQGVVETVSCTAVNSKTGIGSTYWKESSGGNASGDNSPVGRTPVQLVGSGSVDRTGAGTRYRISCGLP